MESRRWIIAIALCLAVIIGVQYLFPAPKQQPARAGDSVATHSASAARSGAAVSGAPLPTTTQSGTRAATSSAGGSAIAGSTNASNAAATPVAAETTVVVARKDSGATFRFSNIGATPVSIVMNAYANRAAPGRVDLGDAGREIFRYRVVANGGAPVDLSATPFSVTQQSDTVVYQASVGASTVRVRYAVAPDSFVAHVSGSVSGAGNGSYLVVGLPQTFAATEPDTADDRNYLSYSYLTRHEAARSVLFRSLDPGEKQLVPGPITWIAAKSKYFVIGLLAPKNSAGFTEATLIGGPRTTKVATLGDGDVVIPITNGTFSFDMYAGPQEWSRLNSLGREFDGVNPYGWAFTRGLMQPIVTTVIRVVLWMHREMHLSYGLVIIALGIIIRLLMWPLYQSSMRTSIKMQVLQPELQAVQDRYKDDPEKQRTEIMKVYNEHGMNPLSPLLGCLPSLLPMPILFALYFVFRSTIELRGVQFLWLADLSAKDPFYILPIIMGLSMYLVSWIGMRNTPPNPQAKMMSYMMPVMLTIFFFRVAAGLNLYYATQNLATIPQQWHLAHERKKVAASKTTTVVATNNTKAKQKGAKSGGATG